MSDASKCCARCKQTKQLSEFYTNKRHRDGLQSSCKNCQNAAARRHYKRKQRRSQMV